LFFGEFGEFGEPKDFIVTKTQKNDKKTKNKKITRFLVSPNFI
jgi:hypothetical protein